MQGTLMEPRVRIRCQIALRQLLEGQHTEVRTCRLERCLGSGAANKRRNRRGLLPLIAVRAQCAEPPMDASTYGGRQRERIQEESN